MKHKSFAWTLANVVVYLVGAVILFGWLTIRASNGGLFGASEASYKVIVPTAPGVEANKTGVLSPSGVRVGVVTNVTLASDGAALELKINQPFPVHENGSAKVVVSNVIGEKAVVVDPGSPDEPPASNNATLASGQGSTIVNPDTALEPLQQLNELKDNPEVKDLVEDQKANAEAITGDVKAIQADAASLSQVLSAQQVALNNLSTRTSSLVDDLAAHSGDIQGLVGQAASLAADVNGLIGGQLKVVEKGISLAADALTIVANHQAEIASVLDRMPKLMALTQNTTDELVRLFSNDKGHFVYLGGTNLPDLERFRAILAGEITP
ncbi:MAG: hypothetical protein U0U69_09940 [Acidimicrobiia bacterium]